MSAVNSILDAVIEKGAAHANFSIILPDGQKRKAGTGRDEFVVKINSTSVYTEILKKGNLGFGEQYMLGNLDIEGDLEKAIMMAVKLNGISSDSPFVKLALKVKRSVITNKRNASLKNIAYHYDLGNDFYQEWLDDSMTYSCAYYKSPNDSLSKAQEQKHEHICRKLMLSKGETVVDIGSGWGSMLMYAAQKYGITGYGVTLSKEQYEYSNKKAKELGLSSRVKFELKDYRDLEGHYDKMVSIGMFEHVGKGYQKQFFDKISEILKPQGMGLLHSISVDREMNEDNHSWILTYIFPGGYLPTPTQILEESTKQGFIPLDMENLRYHYALTLQDWIDNYERIYDKVVTKRGVEFARMWRLYLYISKVSFVIGASRLYQLTFSNGINNNIPITREHIYKSK